MLSPSTSQAQFVIDLLFQMVSGRRKGGYEEQGLAQRYINALNGRWQVALWWTVLDRRGKRKPALADSPAAFFARTGTAAIQ